MTRAQWKAQHRAGRLMKRVGGENASVRLVYYFCDAEIPLFMITVFAKNERANLSKAERNELAKLATALRDGYRGRRGEK